MNNPRALGRGSTRVHVQVGQGRRAFVNVGRHADCARATIKGHLGRTEGTQGLLAPSASLQSRTSTGAGAAVERPGGLQVPMTAACRARADLRWMSTSNDGYVTARVPRPYAPRKVGRELIAYMVRPDRQPRCPDHVWRLAGHFPRETTRDASTDADPAPAWPLPLPARSRQGRAPSRRRAAYGLNAAMAIVG